MLTLGNKDNWQGREVNRKRGQRGQQTYLTKFGYLPDSNPETGNLRTEDQLRDAIRNLQKYHQPTNRGVYLFQRREMIKARKVECYIEEETQWGSWESNGKEDREHWMEENRFSGIPVTGEIDDATRKLMKARRCGLADRQNPRYSRTRRKRFTIHGQRWPYRNLTWSVALGDSLRRTTDDDDVDDDYDYDDDDNDVNENVDNSQFPFPSPACKLKKERYFFDDYDRDEDNVRKSELALPVVLAAAGAAFVVVDVVVSDGNAVGIAELCWYWNVRVFSTIYNMDDDDDIKRFYKVGMFV
ncbi:hypothetical protein M0804_012411 [Polistes exclamans]|nr:hypothetical protein M0804_012411 [Polistes exclamans]